MAQNTKLMMNDTQNSSKKTHPTKLIIDDEFSGLCKKNIHFELKYFEIRGFEQQ